MKHIISILKSPALWTVVIGFIVGKAIVNAVEINAPIPDKVKAYLSTVRHHTWRHRSQARRWPVGLARRRQQR